MDISKEFEDYKKEWCRKHNRPMFKDSQVRIKMAAWKDFVEEVLTSNYAQISQDYKNMRIKTIGDWKQELAEQDTEEEIDEEIEEVESIIEETQEISIDNDWDLVKKIMDEM